MRTLNERFTDDEFAKLKDEKGDRSWHDAILEEFGVHGRTEVINGGESNE